MQLAGNGPRSFRVRRLGRVAVVLAVIAVGVAACGDGQMDLADHDDVEENIDDDLDAAPEEPVDEAAPPDNEPDGDQGADEWSPNQRGLRAGPFVDADGFQYHLRAAIEWQPAVNDPLRANPGETDVGQDVAARVVVQNAMDDRIVNVTGSRDSPIFGVYGTFDADRPVCQLERFSETRVAVGNPWPWAYVTDDSCWFPYGLVSTMAFGAGDDSRPEIMPGDEISAPVAGNLGNLGGVTESEGEQVTDDLDAGPDGIAVLVQDTGRPDRVLTPLGVFDLDCFDEASEMGSGVANRMVVFAEATFEGDARFEEVAGCS